jgi:hypothetical protein
LRLAGWLRRSVMQYPGVLSRVDEERMIEGE